MEAGGQWGLRGGTDWPTVCPNPLLSLSMCSGCLGLGGISPTRAWGWEVLLRNQCLSRGAFTGRTS